MKVAIVKYNAGNIKSVTLALQRLGIEPILTDDADLLRSADKVIFPGVGEAGSAMRYLRERKLDQLLPQLKQPFLGVCLGLQLMCKHSEEGDTDCLGIFPNHVKLFPPQEKVPHMGWNLLSRNGHSLFEGLSQESYFYFVHSYFAEPGEYTIAQAHYIQSFSAVLHRDNFYAIQPHPEKSGKEGERFLENFLKL
jgi:imidazole glycerol-phosphate synthase subunit HisH